MVKRIWKIAASVKTTFWLLLSVTLFFIVGSLYFRFERQILPQLNFSLIQHWIRDYGAKHLELSWWFFILVFLLFLLGVNTFACMCDRLLQLLPLYKKSGRLEFAVAVMPTVIHLVFFLILTGHLLSSICGSVEVLECRAGQTLDLPGGRRLQVLDVAYDFHQHPASLRGKLKGCRAELVFITPRGSDHFTVRILGPVFRGSYSFHLDSFDKYARENKMRLILRRDVGIRVIIPGLLVIIVLLAWYFPALPRAKRKNALLGG